MHLDDEFTLKVPSNAIWDIHHHNAFYALSEYTRNTNRIDNYDTWVKFTNDNE